MFKNLKISTGIYSLLSLFTASFIIMMSFYLFSVTESNDNFSKSVTTSDNMIQMQNSVNLLNRGLAQLNAVMVEKLLNRSISESDIAVATQDFSTAKKGMVKFLSTPFDTEEEKKAAENVKAAFDEVATMADSRMKYAFVPLSLPDTIDKEVRDREKLRKSVEQYANISLEMSRTYIDYSDTSYREMLAIFIAGLVISISLIVISRIWLNRAIFTRLNQTITALRTIASGKLNERVETGARNEIGSMLAEMEKMRVSLTETVYGIRQGVKRIHLSSQEIANGNNDLSSRTEEQASALQQTAASMEELKITVRQNADNAHNARQLADSASNSARNGGEVMVNLDDIMRQIMQSSRQIADINSVIDSIANQTNILALNAAVEAARAGEQGRGFAVVAGEVRNLAKRSADAAKESHELITNCVATMATGSQHVEKAGAAMKDIVNSVIQVTDIMAEITSASDEQSTGINQIAQAVNEMDLVTQQNAAMVEESATAANDMENQAEQLNRMVAQFQINENENEKLADRPVSGSKVTQNKPVFKERITPASKNDNDWETF